MSRGGFMFGGQRGRPWVGPPVGSAAAAFLFFIESPSGISTLNTHLTFSPTLLASINFNSNHPD